MPTCQAIHPAARLIVYSAFVVYVNWWLYKLHVFIDKHMFEWYSTTASG